MKQSSDLRPKELFPGSETVRRFSFKIMDSWDNYAHFQKMNETIVLNACRLKRMK